MDNEYISIKEFAERAKLSRQTVYRMIEKDLKNFCKMVDNKKCISVTALDKISVNDVTQNSVTQVDNLIQILSHQLQEKDNQIKEKNKQIEELQHILRLLQEQQMLLSQSLTNSQALHAGTIKEHIDNKPTKKRLFSWIFKKS